MHFILGAAVLYILFAERRIFELKKKIYSCERGLQKLNDDKSLWYSSVLPEAGEMCLFEEKDGSYHITTIADKRWLTKDGSVDFSNIKRWLYMKELEKM